MLLPSSVSEWVGPGCGDVIYFLIHESTAPAGLGFLIVEISTSDWHTPHSVGHLWMSDQPDAETFTWRDTKLSRDRRPFPGGIRTRNSSKRAGAALRLRPRDHWDRQSLYTGRMKEVTCQTNEKSRGDRMCAQPIEQYDRWCFCLWYTFYSVHHISVWRALLEKPELSSNFLFPVK
jgi:hypothetical protein